MNNDLMQKLVVAKKIMDVHNSTPRGQARNYTPNLENFEAPAASYNIPQEYLSEAPQTVQHTPQGLPTRDKILNSKLPNEIKQLMMEHPIEQPSMGGPTLSNDLVEAAARLMRTDARGNEINPPQRQPQGQNVSGIDYSLIKSIVRDTINEVLSEKGLIPESTSKTKEPISFRVGQHVFEGVVTKIKKMK